MNLPAKLKEALLKRTVTPTVYHKRDHNSWGDTFSITDQYEPKHRNDMRGRVTGWMSPKPSIHDILEFDMESGKTGRFRITSIKYTYDPPDMFFAEISFIGYAEEL